MIKHAKELRILYFRGVFMKNKLPFLGPHQQESAIVNLNNDTGPDTLWYPLGHPWVAYKERGNTVVYFNSFGNFKPSRELMIYLNNNQVE